ncbi:nucleoporin Nup35 [Teleopsis dalmanni]|uniref:nucleoporin Nup35 n=1 Tax=Teleopsis dalmanni TaxID=139649 RepID=UPI0018CE5645|nr:nucleoporin Nup35 [Teleopsis dalmanni]
MEPMNLGSPSGSPATSSPYLPSFLMGDPTVQGTQNALSPNKGGRNVSFSNATPTGPVSPKDKNRQVLGQKTLFGNYQQSPSCGGTPNFNNTSMQNHNSSISGPPTQGLFDTLRNERFQVQTPVRNAHLPQFGTPGQSNNVSGFGLNQSYQSNQQTNFYNDSRISANNTTHMSRSMLSPLAPVCLSPQTQSTLWITVFGFPITSISTILQHFSQCGTIVDKIFPSQNGNWVHIKYSSLVECDRALNFNEKIITQNIMIGVTRCKDRSIVEKENMVDSIPSTPKIRNLAHPSTPVASKDVLTPQNQSIAQRSSGIMNKAIDLFFGW